MTDVIFRRLALIGIGLIGASIALAARRAGLVEQGASNSRTAATLARLRVERDGAVLVDENDREQWLIGAWRLGALRAAMPADPQGRSLRSVLGTLDAVRVPALPGECADVDTPADLRTLDR